MLARRQRLSKKRIEYLFKKGQRLVNSYFTVKYLSTSEKFQRFCVVVSIKVAAKANQRNLLRRRIYATLGHNQKILNKNYDIIIITKASLLALDYEKLNHTIIALLKNIK